MISATMTGDLYAKYFGFSIPKFAIPIFLLVFMKLTVPESSFSSHLFGILAALSLKYGYFYKLGVLPNS